MTITGSGMRVLRAALVAFAALWMAPQVGASAATDAAIADRIKPVGEVCLIGDPCATAAPVVAAGGADRGGEEVYNSVCGGCHGSGVMGAPKLGDVAQWAPRLEKGVETLVSNAINGINMMPPKGGCGKCSDKEIENAVVHMVDASK